MHGTNDAAFYKVGEKTVSLYSPERVFAYLHRRKTKLHLHLFTGGKRLGGVKQFDFESGAEKWGGLAISSERELRAALPSIIESMKRVRRAVRINESTGWYAKVDVDEEEE